MKAKIHVNQQNIQWNAKTYKSNEYANSVEISGPSRVVYSPDKPLSCGAKVWIECEYEDIQS